jgi:hypothetical protein
MARPREGTPISINLPKNALTQIRVGYPSLQPEKRRFLGPHHVRNNGSYGLLERTGRYTRKLAAERSPRAPSMQQPQVRKDETKGCLRKEETGLRPLHVGVNKSRRRRFRGVCWILKSERVPFLLWAFVLRLATSYWFFSSTAVSILATWLTPQF